MQQQRRSGDEHCGVRSGRTLPPLRAPQNKDDRRKHFLSGAEPFSNRFLVGYPRNNLYPQRTLDHEGPPSPTSYSLCTRPPG
jgi:hypothetical protein